MHRSKVIGGLALAATLLLSNAAALADNLSSEVRSAITADVARECIAGRPAIVQGETQIQAHTEFCNCAAEFAVRNLKEEDLAELEKDNAGYKRNKKVEDALLKQADAVYAACRDRAFK